MIDRFRGEFHFLSNFFFCPVTYEGIVYPSSEHAFQAAKTLDRLERLRLSRIRTCEDVKAAGRRQTLRPNWNQIRVSVMEEILCAKFFENPDLAEKLLATGQRQLVEGNHWSDHFWGVCRGTGENQLGLALMRVREAMAPPVRSPK